MAKKMKLVDVRHRAYCETCGKPVGKWTDEETAYEDAERHLISRPDHEVKIVIQQTSEMAFKG